MGRWTLGYRTCFLLFFWLYPLESLVKLPLHLNTFFPCSLLNPIRYNPTHVSELKNTKITPGNIFGTANNYRINSSWHPMPTTVKFFYNCMRIKHVIFFFTHKTKKLWSVICCSIM
jgi:hypothetical protein